MLLHPWYMGTQVLFPEAVDFGIVLVLQAGRKQELHDHGSFNLDFKENPGKTGNM
jgi:hypothetical protein